MAKITVQNTQVTVISINDTDYISLNDIARYKSDDPNAVIANWLRNRNTIEFLGIWETLYNPEFKPPEFEGFRKEAGLNAFTLPLYLTIAKGRLRLLLCLSITKKIEEKANLSSFYM